jgi:hypothetical protein
VKDAGTDASVHTGSVYCGQDEDGTVVSCTSPAKLCCARYQGGGSKSFECASSGLGSCAGGIAIKCDDGSDCPSGQICCGAFDQNLGYRQVQCQTTCNTPPLPNTSPVRFCDLDAATDECTSIGKVCTASGSLPGFSVCK